MNAHTSARRCVSDPTQDKKKTRTDKAPPLPADDAPPPPPPLGDEFAVVRQTGAAELLPCLRVACAHKQQPAPRSADTMQRMRHGGTGPAQHARAHARTSMRLLQPTREYLKPDNQLALSEAELAEEIPRMLNANNPAAPKNVAR